MMMVGCHSAAFLAILVFADQSSVFLYLLISHAIFNTALYLQNKNLQPTIFSQLYLPPE